MLQIKLIASQALLQRYEDKEDEKQALIRAVIAHSTPEPSAVRLNCT